MKKGDYLRAILRSKKTVLTTKDIFLLWQANDLANARVRLHYYVQQGYLHRIRKGLYAKSHEYNSLELATRIFSPSYVSFETVLVREGLIFQFQQTITVASYLTRKLTIETHDYSFRKIKASLLTYPLGITHQAETSIACKERAFLDMLYVGGDFYFDNLQSLDKSLVLSLLPIYANQRLTKKVKKLL